MKKTDQSGLLGTGNIPTLVLRFTATTFFALVLNSIYTLTDALFVSWGVGDHAMGGVSIVYPFVILQGAISTAVGSGAASIVSRKLGAGKPEEAGRVTLHAMGIFYGSAILVTIVGFLLMRPLLQWMGVTPELKPYATQYFTVILAGNIFSTGFSSIIRAEGKMTYGLLIWVIPISINILLDAVFILWMGLGVWGSALATVICQLISFLMSILFFTRLSTQRFQKGRFQWKQVGEILSIGLPSLVQMGSLSLMSAVLNNVLREAAGTLGVSTFAYVLKIVTFGVVPFTAVAQALAPIVGYNYGAAKQDRVRKTVIFSAALCMGYAVLALAVGWLFAPQLIRIFTANTEMIQLGARGLNIIALSFPFMALPMLAGAAFQAVGQKAPALLMYASNMLFLVPAAWLLVSLLGIDGVWWSYTLSNVLAAALAVLFFLRPKSRRALFGERRPG